MKTNKKNIFKEILIMLETYNSILKPKEKYKYKQCYKDFYLILLLKEKYGIGRIKKRNKKIFLFLRQQIRNYDKLNYKKRKKCLICETHNKLETHHLSFDINRKIITLCYYCHKRIHKNMVFYT